jgi:transposase
MLRLRDDQWDRILEHFHEEHVPDSRPGCKPVPTRAVLDAVLWILNTGAQWHLLPQCYPNYKTVHRRFQQWCQREILRDVLTQLASVLAVRIAFPTNPPTARPSFPAARVAAVAFAFFTPFFRRRLVAGAALVAIFLTVRALVTALRPRLFPLRTSCFPVVFTFVACFFFM